MCHHVLPEDDACATLLLLLSWHARTTTRLLSNTERYVEDARAEARTHAPSAALGAGVAGAAMEARRHPAFKEDGGRRTRATIDTNELKTLLVGSDGERRVRAHAFARVEMSGRMRGGAHRSEHASLLLPRPREDLRRSLTTPPPADRRLATRVDLHETNEPRGAAVPRAYIAPSSKELAACSPTPRACKRRLQGHTYGARTGISRSTRGGRLRRCALEVRAIDFN